MVWHVREITYERSVFKQAFQNTPACLARRAQEEYLLLGHYVCSAILVGCNVKFDAEETAAIYLPAQTGSPIQKRRTYGLQ